MCANGSGSRCPSSITRMSPVSFSAKNNRPSGANAMFDGNERPSATSSGSLEEASDVEDDSIHANPARMTMETIRRTSRVWHGSV